MHMIHVIPYAVQKLESCQRLYKNYFICIFTISITVNDKILLDKMERYGIRGVAKMWFEIKLLIR